jgi:acetyl-CoA synthetase
MAPASEACPCEPMDSEDMLFLLYTSGSTGKPKGIVHTTAGYLAFVQMTRASRSTCIPDSGQLFWCTADIGWVTGHSYVLYGILMNRVPTLMYEGAPNFPTLEGRAIASGTSSRATASRTSTPRPPPSARS